GTFVLAVPPGDDRFRLEVRADGYCPDQRDLPASADRVAVTLLESVPVSGVVRDASGRPLAGVAIAARSGSGATRSARSAASGRHSVAAEPGGAVAVAAYRHGAWLEHAVVESTGARRHDFVLEPDDGVETVLRMTDLPATEDPSACVAVLKPKGLPVV